MDVELYNFIDVILRKYRMGKLWDEMQAKEINDGGRDGNQNGQDEAEDEEQEQIAAQMIDAEEDDETMKIDGIWPIRIGPDGIPLRRNPSDVMQNFFISFVVRSFTELDEILQDLANNGEQKRLQRFAKEIKVRKAKWNKEIFEGYRETMQTYNDFVREDLMFIYQLNEGHTKSDLMISNDQSEQTASESK